MRGDVGANDKTMLESGSYDVRKINFYEELCQSVDSKVRCSVTIMFWREDASYIQNSLHEVDRIW